MQHRIQADPAASNTLESEFTLFLLVDCRECIKSQHHGTNITQQEVEERTYPVAMNQKPT
jgi:hypothetical protein